MAGIVPTNINAYYRDLIEAKQAAAVAAQKVSSIEDQIQGMGHPLPSEDGSIPEVAQEDTASSNDVSASEATPETSSKPIEQQTRPELDQTAQAVGVNAPDQFDTKQDVKDKIESLSAETDIKNTDAKK